MITPKRLSPDHGTKVLRERINSVSGARRLIKNGHAERLGNHWSIVDDAADCFVPASKHVSHLFDLASRP